MKNKFILKFLLLAGAAYFAAIALVHMIGLKVPGLYIYFDVPSHRYQDQIISFLVFGWASFFYAVSRNLQMIKYLLLPLLVGLGSLAWINFSNDFSAMVTGATTTPYWIELGLLCIYAASLMIFGLKIREDT